MLGWFGMKRIKQIIEALKVLSRTPSAVINDAWEKIRNAVEPGATPFTDEQMTLVDNIMSAVVGLAQEMEKPAKAPETN